MALGQSVPVTTGAVMAGPVAVAHEGALLAIGETEDGLLKPRKVFTA
jgi:hypothetical protein